MTDSNGTRRSSVIAIAFAASVFLLALWSVALADETGAQSGATAMTAEGTIAPRGQRMTRDIKYGDWRKVCFKTPGSSLVCRTSITGTWDTGQPAVRAHLIEREGEGAARLQFFLPVGLYLPAGVKVTVDQNTSFQFPYVWCLTNTCIAAGVADPELIRQMETGQTLALEVVDANVLTISTAVPMAHFAAARNNGPATTYTHEVDE